MSAMTQISMQLPEQPPKRGALKPGSVVNPSVVWDAAAGCAYAFGAGNTLVKSKDLIRWEKVDLDISVTLKQPGFSLLPKEGFFRTQPEFRCYTVNPEKDAIELMVSSKAQGPYLRRGTVLTTYAGEDAVAACPKPFADTASRSHYLVYGKNSGIFVLNLNMMNGMAHETGLGTCVARRPSWANAVSSPSLTYNEETGYYYLILTYGDDTDSNIRVGRSRSVTGPYVDAMGRQLTDVDDFEGKVGTMILAGYRLDDHTGFSAPADAQIFQAGELGWMMSHTAIQDGERVLQIRRVIWTEDGWPVVSPECYGGETLQDFKVTDLPGRYETVSFMTRLPQAVTEFVKMELLTPKVVGVSSTRNNWAFKIPADSLGRVELGGSHRGSWIVENDKALVIRYPNFTQKLYVLPAWDWELNEPTIVLTGLDSKGQAVWAKRRDLPPRRRP